MTTLSEIQAAILQLPPTLRAKLKDWVLESMPPPIDPNSDGPELEAELLKVSEESFTPYSETELRTICERMARELRVK